MAQAISQIRPQADRYGRTMRRDAWWRPQLLTVLILGGFVVYSTIVAFLGKDYFYDPYLSPFYSPELWGDSGEAWFGNFPDWWPGVIQSAALIILVAPLSFRTTCYYYRKAYYRAFFADPPACGVGELKRNYRGETRLFIFQNLHRFAFYLATIVVVILWIDAIKAFFFPFGVGFGLGTAIMLVNVVLLSFYTFSCHSFRHLVGGSVDCFSCVRFGKPRLGAWKAVSAINEHHMLFAWMSLISVAATDVYIRLLATGVIGHDPHFGG